MYVCIYVCTFECLFVGLYVFISCLGNSNYSHLLVVHNMVCMYVCCLFVCMYELHWDQQL